MSKIIIDTNVLIYNFDKKSKFYKETQTFFRETYDDLHLSSKVIAEFFSVCSKLGIGLVEAFSQYYFFKNLCELVFVDRKSTAIFETLIDKYDPLGNQVYDVEVASVMIANNIKTIYTYNHKDFERIEEISILELN